MALRFRAVSIEATVANPDPYHRRRGGPRLLAEERVVRKDGAIGPRTLVITWYPPDEESPTAEVSLHEIHHDGRLSLLMKKRRVDNPKSSQGEIHRIAPNGQGLSLHSRMHWPKIDCVLKAEDIVPGEKLPLFGLPIKVLSAEDATTRKWLKARGLPGSDLPLPPPNGGGGGGGGGGATATSDAAAVSSEAPRVEETLSFFLGGPRPHAARRPSGGFDAPTLNPEMDETARIRHNNLTPMPALRERPAVHGKEAPPLPSEVEAYELSRRYGNTRVLFKARLAAEPVPPPPPQEDAPPPPPPPPPLARAFLLEFYVADGTLAVSELHVGSAGSQFSRRHGPVVGHGGELGVEKTPFLRRGRQPKDLSTYLRGVGFGHAPPIGGGGGYGRGGDAAAYVSLSDLRCGGEVCVAGTHMRIVCCEPSSRALLVGKGLARELGLGGGGGGGPGGRAMFPGEDEEAWAAVP